jgi:putative transposase
MMVTAIALPASSGLTSAVCSALSLSRASVLRHRAALTDPPSVRKPRPLSARALPQREQDQVLQSVSRSIRFEYSQARPRQRLRSTPRLGHELNAIECNTLQHLREPRFADQTPTEVFATLLDEGTYLCSIRTM